MSFTERIKSAFRRKDDLPNVYHVDFRDKVEEAFVSRGVQYYRMKRDTQIPYGRYRRMQEFLLEYDLRMKLDTLIAFLDDALKHLSGVAGTVRIDKAVEVLLKAKARTQLAFTPQQAYNLATIVYFDDKENLYGYDEDHNKKKVKAWMEDKKIDFFYTRPLDELLGLSGYSETALIDYIQVSSEIINDLTSDIT